MIQSPQRWQQNNWSFTVYVTLCAAKALYHGLPVQKAIHSSNMDGPSHLHGNNAQNPLVQVRRPNNGFIHTIEFPKLVRWHLYIETGPCDRGLFQYKDVLLPAGSSPSRSSLSWGTGLPVGSHSSQSTPALPLPVALLYNPPYTVPTLSLSHSIIQSPPHQHPQHNSHR